MPSETINEIVRVASSQAEKPKRKRKPDEPKWCHLDVRRIKHETDDAFLVVYWDWTEKWIPKACVDGPDEFKKGDYYPPMNVRQWFCERNGMA